MAISFIASAEDYSTSATSLTVTQADMGSPSWEDDDFLIAVLHHRDDVPAWTISGGGSGSWTELISDGQTAGTDDYLLIAYKKIVAGASETTSYVATSDSNADTSTFSVQAFRGVDATLIGADKFWHERNTNPGTTTVTYDNLGAGDIDIDTSDAWIVGGCINAGTTPGVHTVPSGWIETADPGSTSIRSAVAYDTGYGPADPPTLGDWVHGGGSNDETRAWALALEEAAGGPAEQPFTLTAISATATLYDPGIAVEDYAVPLSQIDSSAVLYDPVVSQVQAVPLTAINASVVLYDPTISLGPTPVPLTQIDSSAVLYDPVITPEAAGQPVPLTAIDSTAVLHEPGIAVGDYAVPLTAIDATAVLYDPDVIPEVAGQPVPLTLIDASAVLYDPALDTTIVVPLTLIDSSAVFYDPTIATTRTVSLTLLDATAVLYEPDVGVGVYTVSLELIDATATLHTPGIAFDQPVPLTAIPSGTTLYTPGVASIEGQAVPVPLIDATAVLYTPTVLYDQLVPLVLIDATAVLYDPTIATTVTVPLTFIADATTLYDPTITTEGQAVPLTLIDSSAVLYAPDIIADQSVPLPLLDATAILYNPQISGGTVPGPSAAPTVVSSSLNTGSSTSLIGIVPGGYVAGDTFIAFTHRGGSGSAVADQAGWTNQDEQADGPGDPNTAIWTRTSTGVEPATYTWTAGNEPWQVVMVLVRNGTFVQAQLITHGGSVTTDDLLTSTATAGDLNVHGWFTKYPAFPMVAATLDPALQTGDSGTGGNHVALGTWTESNWVGTSPTHSVTNDSATRTYAGIIHFTYAGGSGPTPSLPDPAFDEWPGRHIKTIDVARKLKAHGLDNTRHIDIVDPDTLPAENLDFMVYSTTLGAWFPFAPFAYGDLWWDYDIDNGSVYYSDGGGDAWNRVDPGALWGPHYLVDEPADGQWRYTGSDARTGRVQVHLEFEIISANTTVEVGLYLNDVQVYTRDDSFQGNKDAGIVIDWGVDSIVDLATDDVIDIRLKSNNAVGVRFFQIQGYFWPKAAGEVAKDR